MTECTNILFIGGCLLNQKDLSREELFHSVLQNRLQKKYGSEHFNLVFGNYWSYSHLADKIHEYALRKSATIVVLFVRPFPMMPLVKPLVKYGENQGKKRLRLHPALLNRKRKWRPILDPPPPASTDTAPPRRKIELRDVNLALGKFLGLEKWMQKHLQEIVNTIHQQCQEKSVKLLVLSPPDNPESLLGSIICRNTARSLQKTCHANAIPFININELNDSYFETDGIHFNREGHRELARILDENLQPYFHSNRNQVD